MKGTIEQLIRLHRVLDMCEAKANLRSKINKNSQKQKLLRGYTQTQIKQRKYMASINGTKHK